MVYTISNGLRDREYHKFTSEQIGSFTGINVSNILKTYDFTRANLTSTGGAGSGLFSVYTSELNGILKAIGIAYNDFEATGSLFLDYSGANMVFNVWNIISGTTTRMVSQSGAQMIKAFVREQNNVSLSGTNSTGVWEDIPLYGVFRLVGSGLGATKTCSGITLVYT